MHSLNSRRLLFCRLRRIQVWPHVCDSHPPIREMLDLDCALGCQMPFPLTDSLGRNPKLSREFCLASDDGKGPFQCFDICH